MAKEKPKREDIVYNDMVGQTTLRGIWMTESRLDMKPAALDLDDTPLKHGMRVEREEAVIQPDGTLYGFINFEVTARRGRQRMLRITARYFVSYHVEGSCDQYTADLFIDRVGRLAAYPYFRALTASLAGQAGLTIPPLPIISFRPRNISFVLDAEAAEGDATPKLS
ncbi:hypothetical protein [Sphingopyxis sp.]|uniref:hypothetical protein n=1 Tax=Sphingopyxis sp. TaxID=1908224 RepID=UPI002D794DD9|nr:hypothetical protein [Sphingopyxis sp.]HET6523180.1 hypothetical protein [Sphingopyxis sp.]